MNGVTDVENQADQTGVLPGLRTGPVLKGCEAPLSGPVDFGGPGPDAADTKIPDAWRAIPDCIGTLAGSGTARELRVLGQDARGLGTANRKRTGKAMPKQMEGYVYLSRLEEQKAREFFRQHRHQIPDMEEGDSVGGNPLVCGLQEHRVTERLVIPRQMTTRQLRRMAVQAAGLTDREWKIWNLHCRGNSQGRIAAKLGINKIQCMQGA
jgi:hypothetical protein